MPVIPNEYHYYWIVQNPSNTLSILILAVKVGSLKKRIYMYPNTMSTTIILTVINILFLFCESHFKFIV